MLVIFGTSLFNLKLIAEYQDIVDSRDILAVYVEEKLPDHEIWWISGDGFCILLSFKVCMEAATGQSITLEDIKQKLKEECAWIITVCFCQILTSAMKLKSFTWIQYVLIW